MNRTERRTRMREIAEEVERLAKFDTLTRSQEEQLYALRGEFATLNDQDRAEELDALRSAAGTGRSENGFGGTATSATEADQWAAVRAEPGAVPMPQTMASIKGQALRALDAVGGDQVPVAARAPRDGVDRIVRAIEEDTDPQCRIARWAAATSDPAYLTAFVKVARDPARGHLEFTGEETAAWRNVATTARAMSLTDTAGGYLVPFQLDPTVIIAANGATNPLRAISRKVVATGDAWNGVSSSAVSWSWDSEASQVSDDAPALTQPTIPIYMARGFVPVSIEAFEDMANGAREVARLLSFGRDVLEAQTLAIGSGSGQPTGIVTALVGGSSVINSAGADAFALGDVYALADALPARFRANASWVANGPIINRIRRFGEGTSGPQEDLVKPPLSQYPGSVGTLLGRPVYDNDSMDGSITAAAENYSLLFGDFSNYVIADRVGLTVEFIPHLFGTANGRPTGQRGWFAYYRSGADSVQDAAFRLLDIT